MQELQFGNPGVRRGAGGLAFSPVTKETDAMKKLIVLAAIFAACSAYAPALAGCGCGGGGGGPAVKGEEFACSNPCPLAKAANTHRSLGTEAVACSSAVRASMTAGVLRNLPKI